MAGKILLINTNLLRPRVAPVGLDYLASALKNSGIEVFFWDMALELKGWQSRLKKILQKTHPDLIGLSIRNLDDCYFLSGQSLLKPVQQLIRWLRKNTELKIVLGGVGFSCAPDALLEYLDADFGIWGDGEEALIQLISLLSQGKTPNPDKISGLLIRGKKKFSRAEIKLKQFYFKRELVNNSFYFQVGGQIGVETKRGCDGKCIYCADPIAKGKAIRLRTPESVVDELEELLSYGVYAFHLCDSEFNRPYTHSFRVLEEICRRGLGKKIHLYSYCSPRPFDRDLAQIYARAGGKGICFGADSGSESILQTLKRDHSIKDLENTLNYCQKFGIKVMYDLLIGGPGESEKTLRETIGLMKKIKPDRVGISYGLRVYGGTELHQWIEAQGGESAELYALGETKNNPGLILPTFYLAPALRKNGLKLLHALVGTDPRFFLPARSAGRQNYNYSGNLLLERLIKKGARGAYWAILMEKAEAG